MLELCRREASQPEAALVLERWAMLQVTPPSNRRERRFRRRAYERARDDAMPVLLMRAQRAPGGARHDHRPGGPPRSAARTRAVTRIGVLLRRYNGGPRA